MNLDFEHMIVIAERKRERLHYLFRACAECKKMSGSKGLIIIMSYEHCSNMSKEQKDRMCSGNDVQKAINQFEIRGINTNIINNNSLK
jgi:hypothetical protein